MTAQNNFNRFISSLQYWLDLTDTKNKAINLPLNNLTSSCDDLILIKFQTVSALYRFIPFLGSSIRSNLILWEKKWNYIVSFSCYFSDSRYYEKLSLTKTKMPHWLSYESTTNGRRSNLGRKRWIFSAKCVLKGYFVFDDRGKNRKEIWMFRKKLVDQTH